MRLWTGPKLRKRSLKQSYSHTINVTTSSNCCFAGVFAKKCRRKYHIGGGEREHDCFCVIQTSIFPVCVVSVITVRRGSSSLFARSTVEIISLCKLPPSLFVVVSAIYDKRQIYRFGGERGERQTFTRPHPPLCTIPNGHSSVELLPSLFQQDCRGLA